MTLTASIAERIGAVPRRTLVIGGYSSFLEQTLRPKLAAWGLRVEWHWETGRRPRDVIFPSGCEVVVYFSDMVDVPATWATLLKRALATRPEVRLIHTVRKAACWMRDFERAGLKLDTNYPLKEPEMPPAQPKPPLPITTAASIMRAATVARDDAERAPPAKERTARDMVAELLALLGELDARLQKEERERTSMEEMAAKVEEAINRAVEAEKKAKALDALRAFLKE